MAYLYGKEYSKDEILKRVGDISQIAGVRSYELTDGNQSGIKAVDMKTGSGFNITILPGRGLDISYAEFKGIPLTWISSTGEVSPNFYEPEGLAWLRNFFGGLLTTCGLSYMGAACEDQGKNLGIHGRISNIPAKNIHADGEWRGDDYFMWVKGKIRETAVFNENLLLSREISAKLGEPKIYINDTVENSGHSTTEHMILYHMQVGFPLLDSGSKLLSPAKAVTPRDDEAGKEPDKYAEFRKPAHGYKEKVYYHDMRTNKDGDVYVAVVNKNFKNTGLGLYLKYKKSQLPCFTEWKMMGEGVYVVGIEPGNSLVEGRAKERERKTLKFLEPGEKKEYKIEVGILDSNEAIKKLEAKINNL